MSADQKGSVIPGEAIGIDISGVNLSYGANHVLKNIDLRIEPGEFFAFLGPSGCGKTTLLRLIAGFNVADSGAVKLGGLDIGHLPPWKRDVGMVFQSYALWPHMNVRRNVAFGLEERRLPRAEITRRVAAALDLVGLAEYADRKPSQLSGGQQQRVALARTIAIEPKVLLLDEPLSNLDAKMRVQVRHELRELQQRLGITTIFVTHDQEEANAISDRIAVMNDGIVQQIGAPMELYANPANLFVANFLGTANILSGKILQSKDGRVLDIGEGMQMSIGSSKEIPADAKFVFRPQDARIGAPGPDDISLFGRIVSHEFLGATLRYRIRTGAAEVFVDAPFHAGQKLFVAGEPATLNLSPAAGLWLSE